MSFWVALAKAARSEAKAVPCRGNALAKSWGIATTGRGMALHPVTEAGNASIVAAAGHRGVTAQHAIEVRPHFNAHDHLQAAEHHATQAAQATSHQERAAHHVLSQAHSAASMTLTRHPHLATKLTANRLSPAS